jgi:hypothetical protein
MMISSGTTAVTTSADAAVDALSGLVPGRQYKRIELCNDGSVAGFYSLDGGTTWARLPADCRVLLDDVVAGADALKVKRIAGGSNLADVYCSAY